MRHESLPRALYRPSQVTEMDDRAIDGHGDTPGIGGYELMKRAGHEAYDVLRERLSQFRTLLVVCGPGNNGGDGWVIARLAHGAGERVKVFTAVPVDKLGGAAWEAAHEYVNCGGEVVEDLAAALAEEPGVVVDALLGVGLNREVEGRFADYVQAMDRCGHPVVAVDVPSGISADTGAVMGCAVHAEVTVTFVGMKRGLLTGAAPAYTGELVFKDLGVPETVREGIAPACERLDREDLTRWLPGRAADAHKGQHGHVLVVGGDLGMGGAVRLTAEAALRAGAGLVSVATRAENVSGVLAGRPELMVRATDFADDLEPLLAKATVVALGPGLGQADWGRLMLERVLAWDGPVVVDADGLNVLAGEAMAGEDWILTPHPGEAARLLARDSADVQADRFAAAAEIAEARGAVVVLKGAGTVVARPDGATALCPYGNPGMATGGVGDVLTGVIAGLRAQEPALGLGAWDAACAGVVVHALAGDEAASAASRGLVASDLLAPIRRMVNPGP